MTAPKAEASQTKNPKQAKTKGKKTAAGAARGKKYREALKKIDSTRSYSLEEAIPLVKQTSPTKFDASVEIHMHLNINPAKADQGLRSTVALPHGTGKSVRVIAFVEEGMVKEALEAGSIKAGADELIEEINKGWLEFDVAIAHPNLMKKLGKVARVLGQKGLMPNPKSGTISPDVSKTIAEVKKGKVEFRNDKNGNLHNVVGKISFGEDQLKENVQAYIRTIVAARPSGVKGNFLKSMTLTSTMGPGIKLDIAPFVK